MRAQDAESEAPVAQPEADAADYTIASEAPRRRRRPALRRLFALLWRNAYLGLAVGAVLLITKTVDFAPPPEVRVGNGDVGALVGDAPPQEFSHALSNPQAVQVRATLRLYSSNELEVGVADPETDTQAKVLSQPVVTTILGMNATVEQTVRVEGGDLEIDLQVQATPRVTAKPRNSKAPPPLTLEHEVRVKSRRDQWWTARDVQRVHLDSRGTLVGVEDGGYRIVFTVDDHLFSLDIEARRAFGAFAGASLASGG